MNKIFPLLLLPLLLILLFPPIVSSEIKFTCPMHPHYISDTSTGCPICGMDLVEIKTVGGKGEGEEKQGLHLSQRLVQTTGLRRAVVETAQYGRSIRSYGEVVANKRLQTDVSLRVEGWIEDLVVNAPGDEVQKGDRLFYIYSPELVSAQQDYLTALRQGGKERIEITKNRLTSLGVDRRALKLISNKREIVRSLPYYASRSGRIENLQVREGGYLRAGSVPLRIQSYQSVWVDVSLAEQDISFVDENSLVNVDFPSLGLHKEKVTIDYIAPTVDPKTRTAKLRLLVENEKGNIRPGAYADVTISTDIRPRLSIPYESVLQNKQGTYVIVEREDGTFLGQEVVLGIVDKGRAEVQLGLKEGETVITSGQFLIDSESSLRESFQKMRKMSARLSEMKLSKEQMVLINHVLESGLYIHEQLTAEKLPNPEVVSAGAQAAAKLSPQLEGTRIFFLVKDAEELLEASEKFITRTGWQELLAKLVKILEPWIVEGRPGYYKDLGLALFITNSGDRWLQFAGEPMNPYPDIDFTEIVLEEKAGKDEEGQDG